MSFTHSSHYTSTEQLPTHVSICTYKYTSRLELLPYGTFFSPLIVHIQSQSPVLQPNSVRLHPHSASNCFNYTASQLSHCRKQQATQTTAGDPDTQVQFMVQLLHSNKVIEFLWQNQSVFDLCVLISSVGNRPEEMCIVRHNQKSIAPDH